MVSDEVLHERLQHEGEHSLVAFSTGEGPGAISLYGWQRRMGHRSMTTIIDMANGAVTGLVLKNVPEDTPKLDSCPSRALTKARRLPFKTGRTRPLRPLELIHGDLVAPCLSNQSVIANTVSYYLTTTRVRVGYCPSGQITCGVREVGHHDPSCSTMQRNW